MTLSSTPRDQAEAAAMADVAEVETRLVDFVERIGLDDGPARH